MDGASARGDLGGNDSAGEVTKPGGPAAAADSDSYGEAKSRPAANVRSGNSTERTVSPGVAICAQR